jgi:hypothetical protein
MLRHIVPISAAMILFAAGAALADDKPTVNDDYCRQGLQCYEDGKCYMIGQFHPKNPDKMKCVYGSGPSEQEPCHPHWASITEDESCKKAQPLSEDGRAGK